MRCVSLTFYAPLKSLQWRHNGRDGVSNHQPHDCLLNHLFRRKSKNTSKLRVTGLCEGNSPVTGEFPAQMASNAENVSIRWRHHDDMYCYVHRVCVCRWTRIIFLVRICITGGWGVGVGWGGGGWGGWGVGVGVGWGWGGGGVINASSFHCSG